MLALHRSPELRLLLRLALLLFWTTAPALALHSLQAATPTVQQQLSQLASSSNNLGLGLGSAQLQAAGYSAATFLPRILSNFVRVIPTTCSTGLGSYTSGICHSPNDCAAKGGTATTTCAMGFGTCCVVRHTCGQTSGSPCHYFTNPAYPNTDTAVTGGTCQLTIQPCQNNVCQIKLDFIDVNLQPPNPTSGVCDVDSLAVTGNGGNPAKIPTLCGNLSGKHMYINVEPTCSPTNINVDMNQANVMGRKFNIKVTQIPCMSKDLAPPGCLQYYNSTSGTVGNFNMGGTSALIAGQNYATCIATKPGYCSITWKETGAADGQDNFMLPGKVDCDSDPTDDTATCPCCRNSYILIPGATCPGVAFSSTCPITDPRFCGDTFGVGTNNEVVSWHQPFMIYTYIPQPLGQTYTGYKLDYTLNRC